jgi:hypothetical protein
MHLRMKATNRKEETTSKWQACQAKMHAAVSLSQVVYRMLSPFGAPSSSNPAGP